MRERLERALPGAGIGTMRARYLRYKPATSCLVAYRVEAGGAEHDLHALTWCGGEGPRFDKAESRRLVPGPLGPGLLRWDDVPAALWSFPNDLEVRALNRLGEPAARRRLLWRLARHRPELQDAAFEPLAYKPARRFVGKLTAANGAQAVVKLYSRSSWAARTSIEQAPDSVERLRLPETLGRSERHRAALLDWLPGELLTDLLRRTELPCVELEAAGAALAELHGGDGSDLPLRDPAFGDEGLLALAETLGRLAPERAGATAEVARGLAAAFGRSAREAELVPVHGDLHAKQIVVDGGRVGLLDLDRAARSSRAEDLGNLLAHLERDGVLGRLAAERASAAGSAFLDGYRRAGGAMPEPAELDRQRAAAMLRLAMHPFRNREPEWRERVGLLLDRVEAAARAGRAIG